MKAFVFRVMLACIVTGSYAQTLPEKVAAKYCECITSSYKPTDTFAIGSDQDNSCNEKAITPYLYEFGVYLVDFPGANFTEQRRNAMESLRNEVVVLMVDRCDRFYKLIDNIRQQIVRTTEPDQTRRRIDSLNLKIAKAPRFVDYYNLSTSYLRLKQFKPAIKSLTEAIYRNNDDVNSYVLRGFAYEGLGKYKKAIEDYETGYALKNRTDILVYMAIAKRKKRE